MLESLYRQDRDESAIAIPSSAVRKGVFLSANSAIAPKAVAAEHGPRVTELDGLRGIAILLVLLHHLWPTKGALSHLGRISEAGWIGVDLFFVLSGYLITGILLDSAGRPHYYRNFIVRRNLRIFPLYNACLGLYCLLVGLLTTQGKALAASSEPWWFAAYAGNILLAMQTARPASWLFNPLWSLQVEEQFYLTFPAIVAWLKRPLLAKLLIGSFFFALALRMALLHWKPHNVIAPYGLMPCRMDALAIGGLIALARRESPDLLKKPWIGVAAALSALMFCAISVRYTAASQGAIMRTFGPTFLAILFGGTLVMLVVRRQRQLLWVCRTRFLIWLGTISYGLYLLHLPAQMIARYFSGRFLNVEQGTAGDFAGSLAMAFLAAWISWTLFESRVLKLKDRFTA